jgi:hypothetical protein
MILFAITTLNHNDYTEALLKSLHETDIYKKGKIDKEMYSYWRAV